MKIYDLDSVKGWQNNIEDYALIAEIGEVEVGINSILHMDNSYYVVARIHPAENAVGVHNIEYNPKADRKYDTDFECPCCGYIDPDAWELSEGEDDVDCGRCGAKLRYSKEPVVWYDVELLEAPPVTEIYAGEATT